MAPLPRRAPPCLRAAGDATLIFQIQRRWSCARTEICLADPKHEKQEETFRVIDRRLFNAEGEIRDEALREEKDKPASQPVVISSKPSTLTTSGSSTVGATTSTAPAVPAVEPGRETAPAVAPFRGFEVLVNFL